MNSQNFGLLTKQNFQTLRPSNKKSFSLKKTHYSSLKSSQKQLQPHSFANANIQLEKSFQFKTTEQTIQRKTSNFLKGYIEKLKRQRKRNSKKKVSLNPRSINKKQTTFYETHHESEILQRQSSILIFKKSQLLDTRGHLYNKLEKYSKDAKFLALLQEIKILKKKEQQQKQKQQRFQIERQLKISLQKQKNQTARIISVKKYERNFNLPNLNKTFFKLPSFPQKKQIQSPISQKNVQFELKSQRKPSQRIKQRIQNFYNFKSLEPWQNTKQTSQLNQIVE